MRLVEAYKCKCGHTMRKYLNNHIFDRMAFLSCCPECGGNKNEIDVITGVWTKKRSRQGIWPFSYTEIIEETFIEK